uniref:Root primordium defective 1 n=1 Tax=Camellia sinensis TaxID=4442 RepID=A0A5P9VKK9_CAMSI|nr:root primordium defective 1 [Camellia sinensis]
MARIDGMVVLVLAALVVSTWAPMSHCSKKPVGAARKEDIPYIKCQVCEKLANQLYQQVQAKQAQISPKKISEYQIIDIAENLCNLKKQEADWILKIDIVEQGDKLVLVEQDSEGQCNSKCKTIERACEEVMGYSDTDVAEYLYQKKPQIDSLTHFFCNDLSKACSVKPPPVPKNRTPGEPFVPKSAKEAEMEKMLKSMEGMPGAPGMKMYSREDLMNMKNFGSEDADEDDDDDEEADFPSKLGKVMREKQSMKSDWKQAITRKIADTGAVLKKHAIKVHHRIRGQWKRLKESFWKKNSKSSKPEL